MKLSNKSEIFTLGLILVEMLYGKNFHKLYNESNSN